MWLEKPVRKGGVAALFYLLLGGNLGLNASELPRLMGLSEKKAVLFYQGKHEVIPIGQERKGIKVVQIKDESVLLHLDGRSVWIQLDTGIQTQYQQLPNHWVTLSQDPQGFYRSPGFINGHSVNFLVDTGANLVALSEELAHSLSLDFKHAHHKTRVETASGEATGYILVLDELTLGHIRVRQVKAIVIEGNSPKEVLLGRSFLNHVTIQENNQLLKLKRKY